MKPSDFKKLIKEAVREAIQEELKEILLEAVRAPKAPVSTGGYGTVTESVAPIKNVTPSPDVRNKYASLLGAMGESRNGNLSMTSNNAMSFGASQPYTPPRTVNTTGEGSSLPPGEVSLDQIAGLLKK